MLNAPKYSLIIPLFNRPDEIKELLDSLVALQKSVVFETIIVEDGSTIPSKEIVLAYQNKLNLYYYDKPNSGPGLSRNFGAEHALGEYVIFLDSDVILPSDYLTEIDKHLEKEPLDAFGGPDKAHSSFTPIQKAINYSMTSVFTTGGIRNKKTGFEKFHPRSFNMGIKKNAFDTLNGFSDLRFGEDIDFSIRLIKADYKTGLIENAYVFHKRRTGFFKFFKQVFNSGIARITLFKRYPNSLKLVHFLPAVFTISLALGLILGAFFSWIWALISVFSLLILIDATRKEKSFFIGLLSIISSHVQLIGYGTGFIISFWKNIILKKKYTQAFTKKFYD